MCGVHFVINNIWQLLRANQIKADESKLVKQPSFHFELLMQIKKNEKVHVWPGAYSIRNTSCK